MIVRIEALRYRGLRYVDQPVDRFQILVGPNASGKSTFLDVVGFLGDLVEVGPGGAILGNPRVGVPQRAPDLRHLVWLREGDRFELAVELAVPEALRPPLGNGTGAVARYEVAIGAAPDSDEVSLLTETLWLKPHGEPLPRRGQLTFPAAVLPPASIVRSPGESAPAGWRKVVNKVATSGNDYFKAEASNWNTQFKLGPTKSALANLPEDEAKFPVATWVKGVLGTGVQRIVLASESMRRPSPPGRTTAFLPDGSNLPWVVHQLEKTHPDRLEAWVGHVREALPDLESIGTREREEDRHRYLVLRYRNGLEAPSWVVSDGTLRLLALTVLAYVPELSGIYLIEEPENGIHPRAVEVVLQSLSSVYDAQVLCATHSPVVLSIAPASSVLCFARDEAGATDIVPGDRHPRLKEWRGGVDLGTLFAAGVLG